MRYVLLTLILAIAACGNDDESNATTAVPEASMLAITLPGATAQQALTTDPSTVRAAAAALADDINAAVALLQDRIDALRASATSTTQTQGAVTCTVWTASTDAIEYRLSECERDRRVDTRSFVLEARATGEFATVAAGRGAALDDYEGQRRGRGVVAYDFDTLRAIRGSGPVGKVAIGYRAAGAVRQLDVGYLNFAFGDNEPRSANLRYSRIVGAGGKVTFATRADVLAPGDTQGTYVNGEDGLDENARASLGWTNEGDVRAAAFACGGTVGQGNCVHWAQCYAASGTVSYEAIVNGTANISFDAQACPNASVDDAPSESEVTATADSSSEIPGAPAVSEPAASADE